MRTQDLRDNVQDFKRYFFYKRGWAKRWRWEMTIARWPSMRAACNVTAGGNDDDGPANLSFHFGFFFIDLYLTIYKALPKQWEIGWFQRDGVRNPRWHEDSHGRQWGFYLHETSLVFDWGRTVSCSGNDTALYGYHWYFWLPWDWGSCVTHEVLDNRGKWVPYVSEYDKEKPPDNREIWTSPYTYVLKSGEVQERVATYYVDRMQWRWRLFQKLPFRFGPKKNHMSISIQFDKEVGERSGSWKGGCVGCSYEIFPFELRDPHLALRRMENERKF